jgi:hypothetical protein
MNCIYCGRTDSFSEAGRELIKASWREQYTKLSKIYTTSGKSTDYNRCEKIMCELFKKLDHLQHEDCGYIVLNDQQEAIYCIAIIEKTLRVWEIGKKRFASGTSCSAYAARDLFNPKIPLVFKEAKRRSQETSRPKAEKAFQEVISEWKIASHLHTDPRYAGLKKWVMAKPEILAGCEYTLAGNQLLTVGHIGRRYDTLFDVIAANVLTPEQQRGIALQLIKMVDAFHQHGRYICDFKPENLFLFGEDVYLADLDSLRYSGHTKNVSYSALYVLKEDLIKRIELSETASDEEYCRCLAQADIAALALTIYTLFTGTSAFDLDPDDNKSGCVPTKTFELQKIILEEAQADAYFELFVSMINPDMDARPDSGTVLKEFHRLFQMPAENLDAAPLEHEQTSSSG